MKNQKKKKQTQRDSQLCPILLYNRPTTFLLDFCHFSVNRIEPMLFYVIHFSFHFLSALQYTWLQIEFCTRFNRAPEPCQICLFDQSRWKREIPIFGSKHIFHVLLSIRMLGVRSIHFKCSNRHGHTTCACVHLSDNIWFL